MHDTTSRSKATCAIKQLINDIQVVINFKIRIFFKQDSEFLPNIFAEDFELHTKQE